MHVANHRSYQSDIDVIAASFTCPFCFCLHSPQSYSIATSYSITSVARNGGNGIRVAAPRQRAVLYAIPLASDDCWRRVCEPVDRTLQRSRVLYSRNTHGTIITGIDDQGLERIYDFSQCPDLLFLNPLAYFLRHPEIEDIYVETIDDDDYSVSHGTASIGRVSTAASDSVGSQSARTHETPLEAALFLRRSEFRYELALLLRAMQHDVFDRWGMLPPPADAFSDVIHSR